MNVYKNNSAFVNLEDSECFPLQQIVTDFYKCVEEVSVQNYEGIKVVQVCADEGICAIGNNYEKGRSVIIQKGLCGISEVFVQEKCIAASGTILKDTVGENHAIQSCKLIYKDICIFQECSTGLVWGWGECQ